MKRFIILVTLTALTACAFAGPFRVGARVHTKQDSILFQDAISLRVWQDFQRIATPSVLESYRDIILQARVAWQFGEMPVKILVYDALDTQVSVEMLVPGKIKWDGSIWYLDINGLEQ